MHILSPNSSASSKCYVDIIIDLPAFNYLIKAQTYLLDSTSNPDVGSSKIIIFEPPTRAIPKDNFLFIPPDNSLVNLCLCYPSITRFKVSSISLDI